jgi:glycosyltransferase involved in cell wall biosynthesis
LIPNYNYARYLREAIDSVLEQDWTDFELLIADNASTDGSSELVARYATHDPRIRVHRHQQNLGMVENFNWCLSQARGEFIKFLCSDDRLAHPRALGQLVGLLKANPSAVLAASARQIIDEESKAVAVWDDFRVGGLHPGGKVIARCLLTGINLIGEPSVVIFRRSDAQGGFDTGYRQVVDLELWLRLLEKGDFVYTPEVLSCFRKHAAQQTEANRIDMIGAVEFARLVRNYLNKGHVGGADGRRMLFRQILVLRKHQFNNPEKSLLKREFKNLLGYPWYALYWSRNRFLRPFQNLQHSVDKRWPGLRSTTGKMNIIP